MSNTDATKIEKIDIKSPAEAALSTLKMNFQMSHLEKYCGQVWVGANPNASIAVINPGLALQNFGVFVVPSIDEALMACHDRNLKVLALWGLGQNYSQGKCLAVVPPETGRAILLPESSHPIFRDILIKGTGPVEKFIKNNKLRDANRGFDGALELSEAERDIVYGEILHLAGVHVCAGIGIVNHKKVNSYPGFTAWTGNYVRAFRTQTRISNLFDLDVRARKTLIDDAIEVICRLSNNNQKMNYVEYFNYMIQLAAKNVAIMQAIGFTQDSFHYGQMTLSGELADFGIGSFRRPKVASEVNTLHPWFRFERQPILILNMLYKTHAVKSEPVPQLLDKNSRSVREQKTLLGAIQSICPASAHEIANTSPEKIFWSVYEDVYRRFDISRFKHDVLDKIEQYFSWSPEQLLAKLSPETRDIAKHLYQQKLDELHAHFENQCETWERRGPTAIHKQIIFADVVKSLSPETNLDFSREQKGIWRSGEPLNYISESITCNSLQDLSWKPYLKIS